MICIQFKPSEPVTLCLIERFHTVYRERIRLYKFGNVYRPWNFAMARICDVIWRVRASDYLAPRVFPLFSCILKLNILFQAVETNSRKLGRPPTIEILVALSAFHSRSLPTPTLPLSAFRHLSGLQFEGAYSLYNCDCWTVRRRNSAAFPSTECVLIRQGLGTWPW